MSELRVSDGVVARALRSVLLAVAGVSLCAGCLFTDQTAAGQTLHNAPKLLARWPSVAVTVTFSSRLVKRGLLTSLPANDPGVSLHGFMDLKSGLADYMRRGATRPQVIFDGLDVYASIPGASPSDARPWISTIANKKLTDLALNPSGVPASMAAYVLRPSLLVDFLSGSLTGSIRRVGPAVLDGVKTTQYAARFDLSQALTDATRVHYSQKQQDDVAKVFAVLGIASGDLDAGWVWIDAQGVPRQMVLNIRESPAPRSELILHVDMKLTPLSTASPITPPSPDTVESVPSLYQYLQPLLPVGGSA